MPRMVRDENEVMADESLPQAPVMVSMEPQPLLPPSLQPSLHEAFMCLCAAMEPYLEESLPDLLHCQEIQGWKANGNDHVAWQHAIQLLEQVLGQKLQP